ncbi:MAG: hypothetical protein WDN04_12355 [Rhodospirillales bacterium]
MQRSNDITSIATDQPRPKRPRRNVGRSRAASALILLGTGAFAGAADAQTGYVGILGGGPVYMHIPLNIKELKKSGFNELIVWSVEVNSTGDLNLNGEFPLTSAGVYIGNQTHPDFPADLAKIRQGTVKRVTFSIGSSNYGDWEDIKSLVDAQGTGPDSILYKDFAALKAALPVDAIDFDDENSYDSASSVKFAVMLGKLGYKVTMNPYVNADYWTSLVQQINNKRANTVDGIHLQAFAGGNGNSPCADWNFGSVPVYPGISDQSSAPPYLTPKQTKVAMQDWHKQCGITGGWVWIFDQIAGTNQVRKYAQAITAGVGGAAR